MGERNKAKKEDKKAPKLNAKEKRKLKQAKKGKQLCTGNQVYKYTGM